MSDQENQGGSSAASADRRERERSDDADARAMDVERADGKHSDAKHSDGKRGDVKHTVTARTKARRRAVEVIFEADQRGLLTPDRGEEGTDEAFEAVVTGSSREAAALRELATERAVNSANHTEAPPYAREILRGVADHLAEVDDAIATYAQGWSLSRMPAVDRAIARVATWEIVWNDDVDAPVAIDEAVTLATMLSTDDSPRYLSGLLSRIGDLADTLR